MVRALDKADAMLTPSSALQNREPFIYHIPGANALVIQCE